MNTNEICQAVTDRVIAELEKGIIPWEKPWVVHTGLRGAFNRVSKKPYSLLNQFLLGEPGEYASFKQWNEAGGKIRKGAKSKMVVFWKPLVKEVENTNEETGETENVRKTIFMLKYYNVFHISQVDGVEPLDIEEEEQKWEHEPIDEAERILVDYCLNEKIRLSRTGGSDKAYYSPAMDSIVLPALKQFKRKEEFYGTAFHEMTHSTGHESRLNRLKVGIASFGNEEYSKEELVAEIGANAMMNILGISTEKSDRNTTAYIQSWLRVLKDDPKMVVSAAGKAEKAVDYILEAVNGKEVVA